MNFGVKFLIPCITKRHNIWFSVGSVIGPLLPTPPPSIPPIWINFQCPSTYCLPQFLIFIWIWITLITILILIELFNFEMFRGSNWYVDVLVCLAINLWLLQPWLLRVLLTLQLILNTYMYWYNKEVYNRKRDGVESLKNHGHAFRNSKESYPTQYQTSWIHIPISWLNLGGVARLGNEDTSYLSPNILVTTKGSKWKEDRLDIVEGMVADVDDDDFDFDLLTKTA